MMQVNEKSQEDKNSISEMSSGWFYFNDGEKIEVELLNQWGIDMIQGYYFSRPVCEEEILKLIVG